MPKKRSPKDIFESVKNPKAEHSYIKFPGQEMIDLTIPYYKMNQKQKDIIELLNTFSGQTLTQENSTIKDRELIAPLQKKFGRRYQDIHTHPYPAGGAYPSGADIDNFLSNNDVKTMVVASQDSNSGKILGYTLLRKRRKYLEGYNQFLRGQRNEVKEEISNRKKWIDKQMKLYGKPSLFTRFWNGLTGQTDKYNKKTEAEYRNTLAKMTRNVRNSYYGEVSKKFRISDAAEKYEKIGYATKDFRKAIKPLVDEFNLQYRFVPAKDYKINETRTRFVKKKSKDLETSLATASIVGLIGGIFFLSSNITGNAIGSQAISNWIGAALLVVGLIAGFFWIKSRKK